MAVAVPVAAGMLIKYLEDAKSLIDTYGPYVKDMPVHLQNINDALRTSKPTGPYGSELKYPGGNIKGGSSNQTSSSGKKIKYSKFTRNLRGGMAKSTRKAKGYRKRKPYSKSKRSKKYSKRPRYAKYDAVIDNQTGGLSSSGRVNVVGHSNVAVSRVRVALWAAAFKHLFTKAGFDVVDGTTPLPLNATDIIELQWRESEAVAGTGASPTITTIGSTSVIGIATYFAQNTNGWNIEGVATSRKRVFTRLIYRPPTHNVYFNSVAMSLQGADFSVKFETKLKLQNRTVEAAGDELVDVNSMPLDCVMFSGKGQGPTWRKEGTVNNFIASSTQNYIATEDNALVRIPLKNEFERVSKQKKFVFAPGKIMMSELKSTQKVEFSKAMNSLLPGASANDKTNFHLGKYELFMFERTMDVVGTTPLPVVVAYDLTAKISVKFKVGRNKDIGTMFVAGSYITL